MDIFQILLIALSMAMDAFTVCLSAGTTGKALQPRPTFRLAFHFGFFQFLLPILGWLAGSTIVVYIENYDHWIAFGLLAFVGVRMIRSGLSKADKSRDNDLSRGWTLILLSIAVSIDALAIGLTLAMLNVVIWVPAVVIGVVTGLVSWLGLWIGDGLGKRFGQRMEIIGGIVLIIIGIRIVVLHMFG